MFRRIFVRGSKHVRKSSSEIYVYWRCGVSFAGSRIEGGTQRSLEDFQSRLFDGGGTPAPYCSTNEPSYSISF
jgi:hypothetical protein